MNFIESVTVPVGYEATLTTDESWGARKQVVRNDGFKNDLGRPICINLDIKFGAWYESNIRLNRITDFEAKGRWVQAKDNNNTTLQMGL